MPTGPCFHFLNKFRRLSQTLEYYKQQAMLRWFRGMIYGEYFPELFRESDFYI